MGTISIRALDRDEWEAFRDLRVRAMQLHPGVFSLAREEILTWTPEDWRAEIAAPTHQIFGLFDGETLIGSTAAFTFRGDPSGTTALLAGSFIEPRYRGRGLSNELYKARLDWIRDSGRFCRVLVSHRASNETSRRANQRHGFVTTKTESRTWPDGVAEDEIFYELAL